MKKIPIIIFPFILLFLGACKKAEVPIQPLSETFTIKLKHDTTFCMDDNQTYIFDASTGNPNSVYSWGKSYFIVDEPGSYSLDIYTDTIHQHFDINMIYVESAVFYPNSFSPNGDGMNDYWHPSGGMQQDGFLMNIYDSNNHLLYHCNALQCAWDGKVDGQLCPAGYYFYDVKYTTLNGIQHHDAGMFELIM